MKPTSEDLAQKHCVPCEGGVQAFSDTEEERHLSACPVWKLDREGIHRIRRELKFKNFLKAIDFVNRVAALAESEGHHPDIHLSYDRLVLDIYTHAVFGLTENDFILAAKIDKLSLE
jgi:4a-hydroxytetrahydrobiopterin dehydratase